MEFILTGEYITAVFHATYAHGNFTCFLISDGENEFFVTCRHSVNSLAPGDAIFIQHEAQRFEIRVQQRIFDENADVAVFTIGHRLRAGIPYERLDSGLIAGQEVRVIGFPLGLQMEGRDFNNGWPVGFIRSGIFSGMTSQGDVPVMHFDVHNNLGLSGAPIFKRNLNNGTTELCGIVCNYLFDRPMVAYTRNSENEEIETGYYVKPNSGFLRGFGSRRIQLLYEQLDGFPR